MYAQIVAAPLAAKIIWTSTGGVVIDLGLFSFTFFVHLVSIG